MKYLLYILCITVALSQSSDDCNLGCNTSIFRSLDDQVDASADGTLSLSKEEFNEWLLTATGTKARSQFFYGKSVAFDKGDEAKATMEARGDLSSQARLIIETTSQSGLKKKNEDEDEFFEEISKTSSIAVLKNPKKYIIREHDNQYSIHLFKCELAFECENDNYDKELEKESNAQLDKFKEIYKNQAGNKNDFFTAFQYLIQSFQYTHSRFKSPNTAIETELRNFLGRDPHRVTNEENLRDIPCLVNNDYSVIIKEGWPNFQYKAAFIRGRSSWKDNAKKFTINSNGRSNFKIGNIKSTTKTQEIGVSIYIDDILSNSSDMIREVSKEKLKRIIAEYSKSIELKVISSPQVYISIIDKTSNQTSKLKRETLKNIYKDLENMIRGNNSSLFDFVNVNDAIPLKINILDIDADRGASFEVVFGGYTDEAIEFSLPIQGINVQHYKIMHDKSKKIIKETMKELSENILESKFSYQFKPDITASYYDPDKRKDIQLKGRNTQNIINGTYDFKFYYRGKEYHRQPIFIYENVDIEDLVDERHLNYSDKPKKYVSIVKIEAEKMNHNATFDQDLSVQWDKNLLTWDIKRDNFKSGSDSLPCHGNSPIITCEGDQFKTHKIKVMKDGYKTKSESFPELDRVSYIPLKKDIVLIPMYKYHEKRKMYSRYLLPGTAQIGHTKKSTKRFGGLLFTSFVCSGILMVKSYTDYQSELDSYNKLNDKYITSSAGADQNQYRKDLNTSRDLLIKHYNNNRTMGMIFGVTYVVNISDVFLKYKKFARKG